MAESKSYYGGRKKILWVSLFVIVMGAVMALLSFLFSSKEVRTSVVKESESITVLYCTGADLLEEPFFASGAALVAKHEIKTTFIGKDANKISYTFKSTYKEPDVAVDVESILHAKYNLYMGGHGLSIDELLPYFGVIDDELTINLYAQVDKLSPEVESFFFLDDGIDIRTYSVDELRAVFRKKGFVCETNERK